MYLSILKKIPDALFLGGMLVSLHQAALAQEITPAATTAPTAEAGWLDQTKARTLNILDNGTLSLMLSGYARHGRNTYTPERLAELNEKAWGLGFSKSMRTAKDNEESLYAMAISDSHFKPQIMAGYSYQWMHSLGGNVEAGVGVTGILISRTDYFSGFPFPAPLPVASIGTRRSKIMAAYVPRFSKNKGNGDVLLLLARFDLD